jgi:hypothetical protein
VECLNKEKPEKQGASSAAELTANVIIKIIAIIIIIIKAKTVRMLRYVTALLNRVTRKASETLL